MDSTCFIFWTSESVICPWLLVDVPPTRASLVCYSQGVSGESACETTAVMVISASVYGLFPYIRCGILFAVLTILITLVCSKGVGISLSSYGLPFVSTRDGFRKMSLSFWREMSPSTWSSSIRSMVHQTSMLPFPPVRVYEGEGEGCCFDAFGSSMDCPGFE